MAAKKSIRKATKKVATKAKKTATKAKRAVAPPKPRAITPYLAVGNAAEAIAWYRKVFGATQAMSPQVGPGGKIMHAHLRIADSDLFLSDIFPGADLVDPARVGASVNLHYYRPNAGHVWERAVANGAKVTMPFADQFWGDTYGKLVDPFGHNWAIARKSSLSKKELEALRVKQMAAFNA